MLYSLVPEPFRVDPYPMINDFHHGLLVRNNALYLALAIASEGDKDGPGLWIEQTEGANFRLKVTNELQDPRPAGYPHRGGGRAQGPSLRHPHGVPAHRRPVRQARTTDGIRADSGPPQLSTLE